MVVTRTSTALWQIAGHSLFDGKRETYDAPAFTGIGFYARPPADGNPEAAVLFVGGAGNPIIAALRDEKTRAAVFAVAGELAPGDAAVFSPAAVVLVKADGTVEIRAPGGAAVALATKADVQAVRDELNQHTHGPGSYIVTLPGPSVVPVTGTSAPGPAVTAPAGTTVLKAQ